MKKYVVFRDAESLQAKHSILGTSRPYTEDRILESATCAGSWKFNFRELKDEFGCMAVYETAEAAAQSFKDTQPEPVFEVELRENNELEKIISATHAGYAYDLSGVWNQHKDLVEQSNILYENHVKKFNKDNILQQQLLKFDCEIFNLKGTLSYKKKLELYNVINEMLDDPTLENINKYKALVSPLGDPSFARQAYGVYLIASAVFLLAVTIWILATGGFAAIGLSPTIKPIFNILVAAICGYEGVKTLFTKPHGQNTDLHNTMSFFSSNCKEVNGAFVIDEENPMNNPI